MKPNPEYDFKTGLVHAGLPDEKPYGAVTFPIFQSSVFEYAGGDGPHGIRYLRYNNTPTQTVLAERIACAHGAEAGLVTSSGMAAITATLLALLSNGDHLLAQNSLYGATYSFLDEDLSRFGIEHTHFDENFRSAELSSLLRPRTRAIYVETITNPVLRVIDHDALTRFARENGLITIIDNSFASPVVFRPLDHGYDIVIESCSKYIGGHTDLVAGSISSRSEPIDAILPFLNHHGGTLDPHAAFLVGRGLSTLDVRVRRQSKNAMKLARWLERQDAARRVWYPGLETHPDHGVATRHFEVFSGMIGMELEGEDGVAERFLDALQLMTVAPSLGGPETLITRPALTSSSSLDEDERIAQGITPSLFRISVGLESVADLKRDFKRGFDAL